MVLPLTTIYQATGKCAAVWGLGLLSAGGAFGTKEPPLRGERGRGDQLTFSNSTSTSMSQTRVMKWYLLPGTSS